MTVHTFSPNAPLVFADEPLLDQGPESGWKIMLVDDDRSIHQATKVALKFFTFEGKSLQFVSAYSAKEAQALLPLHPDTALILLDVIMETKDAGLRVAQHIREVIHNKIVRIILRTGQPGEVPEESVVVAYDINDYKTKLELTQQKLFTTLVSNLRSYRDLLALQHSQDQLSKLNLELQDFNHDLEHRVTERTQALEQKNSQLAHEVQERQKAEQALRIYIHAITHDLRNPVTGMMTVLNSLLKRSREGDQMSSIQISTSVLERMKAGCDRQLKMISSLIEAHEVDVWGVSLHQQPFSIAEMLQGLAEEWKPNFATKRMAIDYQIAPGLPKVNCDRNQIWRVFENLLANVLKYNPPGISVSVTVMKADHPLSFLRCSVADNGVGLASDQITDLFELYQRGSSSPTRGLGIGLYICRRIIETHGGNIGINSQLGAGSEFWFTLPIMKELP